MARIYRANFREYGDMPDPRQETPVRLQRVPNRSRPSKRGSPLLPAPCATQHPRAWKGGVLSTPYLMIISEAVGSWLKSEWISVAALRKCRSRGPGVWGRLAAEQEEGGRMLKARSAEERAPVYGCGPLPQTLDIYRTEMG